MLLAEMEKDLSDVKIDNFQRAAKEWVNLCYTVNCSTDITPYMHVVAYLVLESMRLHGNINQLLLAEMEKDLSDVQIDNFQRAAKEWVNLCYTVNCSTDITPYMHVFNISRS